MRRKLIVPLLIPLFGGVARSDPPPAPPAPEAIDRAIARGVAWLREEREPHGIFGSGPGETALALLALRHSGVPAADEDCTRAARALERALPDGSVYGAALGVLALLEQDPRAHRKEIEKLVRHLVRGQCRNGQWTYAYRSTARKKAGDNSNTQLAILALAAARVRRFDVPDETFAKLRAYLLDSQNEDGGFGYAHNQRPRSYGSMTAGCAMALALCARTGAGAGAADGTGAGADAAVARALGWLGRDFDAARNRDAGRAFGKGNRRGDSFWKHYWLWSLERACAAAGAGTVGDRDWYAEGARHLLATQQEDGSWRDPERSLLATPFALLFLTRSTQRVLTPRPGDEVTTPSAR